jgi:hypothetical protein
LISKRTNFKIECILEYYVLPIIIVDSAPLKMTDKECGAKVMFFVKSIYLKSAEHDAKQ